MHQIMAFKFADLFTTFTKDKSDKINFRRNKTLNKAASDTKSKQQQNPPIQFNIFSRQITDNQYKATSDLKQLFSIALTAVLTKSNPLEIANIIQNKYDSTYISKFYADEITFLSAILGLASDNILILQEQTAENAINWFNKNYFWLYFYNKYNAADRYKITGYVILPKYKPARAYKIFGHLFEFDIYTVVEFLYAVIALIYREHFNITNSKYKIFGVSYLPKKQVNQDYRLFGAYKQSTSIDKKFRAALNCLISLGYISYLQEIKQIYKIAQTVINQSILNSSAGDSKSIKDRNSGQLKKESSSSTDTAYVSKGSKFAEKNQSAGKQSQTNSSEHQSNASAIGNKSRETNKNIGILRQDNSTKYTNNNSASGSKSKTSKTSASSATGNSTSQYNSNSLVGTSRTNKIQNSASLQDARRNSIIHPHSIGYSKIEDSTSSGRNAIVSKSILTNSDYAIGNKYEEEVITSVAYSLCLLYYVAKEK